MSDLSDFDKKKFDDDIYLNAIIDRNMERGPEIARANRALVDLASYIQLDCGMPQLKDGLYLGSAALHLYLYPTINELAHVCQVSTLGDTHERLASLGFEELKKKMQEHYGRKPIKRRSGF